VYTVLGRDERRRRVVEQLWDWVVLVLTREREWEAISLCVPGNTYRCPLQESLAAIAHVLERTAVRVAQDALQMVHKLLGLGREREVVAARCLFLGDEFL